jgi:2-keto-3-deoxy-L-rhamnonate aldolase RhmA
MQAGNTFREMLRSGKLCIGTGITLSDPLVTEALCDSVDFFWIDLEHTGMNPETLAAHMLAARGRGVPALVRVPGSDTPWIKPVLDAGADGIIVPQVRSADEVRAIVSDCRYPPLGRRGFGPRVPSNYGRSTGPDYVERANHDVFVVAQIENAEAMAALDDILAVPGLDSVALGPWDLSASLGVMGQVEHPIVVQAIETVVAKARAAGIPVGTGTGALADFAVSMARRGIQWIQLGNDYEYMVRFMDDITGRIRNQLTGASLEG